ncbi:hypothetical protein J7I93_08725 [Bacillus sp. ISL-47]|uniref:hypothetical protein n=1 Tax=Bacillus sp. ISL-47 TaxID=2819130 RepID=UPI001BE78F13|nr:hypothetical protein [Bacillus sp. ISL-47]MBT2688263.1 hypothetical protein [Bacillus sp. ISL-47]MBT2710056.1 hypothetical protein [Pseudomonas sp. ISL-84]
MPYIDQAFYNDVYKGTPMDAETFTKLEIRASDLIDRVTNYQLMGVDLSQQPSLIQTNVKKAVAAQIEYMYLEGGELSVHGGSPSSVSIGGFSYTEGSGVKIVSEMARNYLTPTGLLYMGVGVRC